MAMSESQKVRLADLQRKIEAGRRLTAEEYLDVLEEIRDNCAITILKCAYISNPAGIGAWTQTLERIGFQIQGVKPQSAAIKDLTITFREYVAPEPDLEPVEADECPN